MQDPDGLATRASNPTTLTRVKPRRVSDVVIRSAGTRREGLAQSETTGSCSATNSHYQLLMAIIRFRIM